MCYQLCPSMDPERDVQLTRSWRGDFNAGGGWLDDRYRYRCLNLNMDILITGFSKVTELFSNHLWDRVCIFFLEAIMLLVLVPVLDEHIPLVDL